MRGSAENVQARQEQLVDLHRKKETVEAPLEKLAAFFGDAKTKEDIRVAMKFQKWRKRGKR